ncbi:shikimate kinase [Brooklawnia cerclae]|uniref:Shikimate kinase n=1 Tax=Brooklawnia cerclae TaxID=349934 RepID=A0ABX0SDS3_9ACTN|nr:shikimate kinase [Brooklawnia cerclae]
MAPHPARTIVLVGAPAVGKSTVGVLLARHLGVPFTDVDERIEAHAGRSIRRIFAAEGEAGFRRRELETTLEAIACPGVVALGGGAVTNDQLRESLRPHHVVWLRVGVDEAVSRAGESTMRPLLVGDVAGKWLALATQREPLYAEVATTTFDTDGLTPSEVAVALADIITRRESE